MSTQNILTLYFRLEALRRALSLLEYTNSHSLNSSKLISAPSILQVIISQYTLKGNGQKWAKEDKRDIKTIRKKAWKCSSNLYSVFSWINFAARLACSFLSHLVPVFADNEHKRGMFSVPFWFCIPTISIRK